MNTISWWTYLRRSLVLCCYPILTAIGGNLILLSNEPARETLEAFDRLDPRAFLLLKDNGYWMFIMAIIYWSVSVWYCSRLLLSMDYPNDTIGQTARPGFDAAVREWLPRILGLFSVLPMTLYFWVHKRETGLWVVPGLFSIGFLAFMIKRRPLLRRWTKKVVPPASARLMATGKPATIAICLMFLLSLLVLCTVWFMPPFYVRSIGAPALLLFAFGSWTLFGSIVLIHIPKSFNWPSLALFPLALFFGLGLWNENHFVAQSGEVQAFPKRKTLAEDFSAWQCARGEHRGEPIYLVAAAGGASRAAYWTGLVLSKLESMARARGTRFSENVYAMSGVSGGSLGVAAFAGSLLDPDPDYTRVQQRMMRFLDQDFLSPTIGYMLYPDLLARLSYPPCVACDRSRALEHTWATDWDEKMPGPKTRGWFKSRLLDLNRTRAHGRWVPNLFLNATSSSDGRRVVQSNLDFVPRQAYDIYDEKLDTVRLTLAGAIHNSARFPYVSPGGLVLTRNQKVWDYVVDGGYFENSGAATLNAIIDELIKNSQVKAEQLRVLVIENDPAHSSKWICNSRASPSTNASANGKPVGTDNPDDIYAVAPQITPRDRMGLLSPELSIPVYTMFNVRTSRAQAAEDETIQRFSKCGNVFELRYPFIDGDKRPPMSWFLDERSRTAMNQFLEESASAPRGKGTPGRDNKDVEARTAFKRNWDAMAELATRNGIAIGSGGEASTPACPGRSAAQARGRAGLPLARDAETL